MMARRGARLGQRAPQRKGGAPVVGQTTGDDRGLGLPWAYARFA